MPGSMADASQYGFDENHPLLQAPEKRVQPSKPAFLENNKKFAQAFGVLSAAWFLLLLKEPRWAYAALPMLIGLTVAAFGFVATARDDLGGRTVFFPGHRIRMNIVPMFLNVFLPWGVFIVCCGVTSFWMLYKEPHLTFTLLGAMFGVAIAALGLAVAMRKNNPEPTWYSYVALMVVIACSAGTALGVVNHNRWSRRFYAIQDLKVAYQVDAGRELGGNLIDAGIIYFAAGNKLDLQKSWHFKQGATYCVAPVTANASVPMTHSYDFWAVGQDCCSTATSDFRCGHDWASASARGGIRVLDQDEVFNYQLAVQQAEALYGLTSSRPIFFEWSKDPLAEINSWRVHAFKNFAFFVLAAFCFFFTGVIFATCMYAWIGRSASTYAMDFYADPDHKAAHLGRQATPAPQVGTRAIAEV